MRALSMTFLSLVLVGCGGRQLGDGVDPGTDAAADGATDTAGGDTSAGDSATEDVPVADASADVPEVGPGDRKKVCDALIAAICGAPTKACCEAGKVPFDVDACTAGTRSWCGFRMDQVEAGIVKFDGSKLDACAKGYVAAFSTCNVDFLSYISGIQPCSQLFDGTRAPGDTCNPKIPDQCKGGGGFAFCDEKLKRCRVYQINGVGSLCNYTGSTVRYCDKGLYCDAGGSGTCKVAKKTGDACLGPGDLSCGIEGNVCKDLKCQPGLPGGATCSTFDECSSLSCDAGKCGSLTIGMATPEVCNGTSTTG